MEIKNNGSDVLIVSSLPKGHLFNSVYRKATHINYLHVDTYHYPTQTFSVINSLLRSVVNLNLRTFILS